MIPLLVLIAIVGVLAWVYLIAHIWERNRKAEKALHDLELSSARLSTKAEEYSSWLEETNGKLARINKLIAEGKEEEALKIIESMR